MRHRHRRRVDWDEELRKTERIRRRGLFVSVLGFGVAVVFIVGASRMSPAGLDIGRKLIFTCCLVVAMFLARGVLRRRERLRREREEREEDLLLSRIRQSVNTDKKDPR
ncbi:MAG: hypothetical protein LBJ22_07480 [Synergistaceae bacterium]|jgi:hypothetical protein|nr:hypothetical protein [Synergistaceae bacterium]